MGMTLDKMEALVNPRTPWNPGSQRWKNREEAAGYKRGFPSRTRDGRNGCGSDLYGGFITTRKMNVGGAAHAQAERAATKAYHEGISLAVSPGHYWR
jgi:hypothetical protein